MSISLGFAEFHPLPLSPQNKLPVPELSDTGRKFYSIACLGDLSRRRFTEDGSLGEDGSIVDSQSSITFGGGGVLPSPSEPSVSESRLARFLRRDRAGSATCLGVGLPKTEALVGLARRSMPSPLN